MKNEHIVRKAQKFEYYFTNNNIFQQPNLHYLNLHFINFQCIFHLKFSSMLYWKIEKENYRLLNKSLLKIKYNSRINSCFVFYVFWLLLQVSLFHSYHSYHTLVYITHFYYIKLGVSFTFISFYIAQNVEESYWQGHFRKFGWNVIPSNLSIYNRRATLELEQEICLPF